MQGRSEDQRDLLDVESVAGHLLKQGSVFAFLAVHRRELFPDGMFTDLFPSGQGRPSVPAGVMATVITLQALHGLSDAETVDAVMFDLRWKAARGLPVTSAAFHPTTLTYWRRRLAARRSRPVHTAGGCSRPGSCPATAAAQPDPVSQLRRVRPWPTPLVRADRCDVRRRAVPRDGTNCPKDASGRRPAPRRAHRRGRHRRIHRRGPGR